MRVLRWFFLGCMLAAGAAAATLETGEIEGAKFTLARPARWNGQILLLAHGYRAPDAPLVADLPAERAAYKELLQDGWALAKTSYRRNGVIIRDALRDLDNLRTEVVRRLGEPNRVLVEGESMGGLIALLLAERAPETPPLYDGVIAIGAALEMRLPPEDSAALNLQPQIPVLFLCNRSEINASLQYAAVKLPPGTRAVRPVVLRVARDGHVNVNQAERFVAFRLLNDWIERGPSALPKPAAGAAHVDVTRIPEPQPSRVFIDEDRRGFTAHVSEVSAVYGNLALDAQPADFAAVGIPPNGYFQVTMREKSVRVFFGKDFSSVKRGAWVLFPNADGFFWLARNGLSAAQALGAQPGDLVHVRKYDPSSNEDPAANPEPPN